MSKGESRGGGQSLTVEDAARLLSCHENHIRDEIHAGNLEAWRLGSKFRIEMKALETYKDKRRVGRPQVSRLRALEGGAGE